MLYCCFIGFKNLLAKAIICHILSLFFCSRHVPSQFSLASHFTLDSLSTSKCLLFTKFDTCYIILLNVSLCVCSHFSLFEDVVLSFFSNEPQDSEISARLGVKIISCGYCPYTILFVLVFLVGLVSEVFLFWKLKLLLQIQ